MKANKDKGTKKYDRVLYGKELTEMGIYKDSNGFLIGTTFTYGVYFPFRSENIIRLKRKNMLSNKDKGTSVGFSRMTDEQKEEITKISKQFASGFEDTFPSINGTGWLIVDPLSGFLNACGYENKLGELPETKQHPQVLIMTFNDGSKFLPAGGDLKPINKEATNWMWL